jgi:hypothetical protein
LLFPMMMVLAFLVTPFNIDSLALNNAKNNTSY